MSQEIGVFAIIADGYVSMEGAGCLQSAAHLRRRREQRRRRRGDARGGRRQGSIRTDLKRPRPSPNKCLGIRNTCFGWSWQSLLKVNPTTVYALHDDIVKRPSTYL